ncbi:MAG: molybdopterin-dependent oxidoreductase [Alphaproteobacteria bacterium]|uniref:Molybdopterin-dependent oxidoreductase n=1 Tax=Candidatus Nitrobium versatile TaxID=2884831 RepID=A0A953M1Z2_9BACT|nr:molybdopterin-dependent oxidoreductase [Candidatus Nitrobium versatile]
MANMVNFTIDGKKAKAPEGVNLIEAAEMNGIHIPNLCFLKGQKGIGACRLCLVEVEGMKAPMIACTSKIKEGMSINTKTEKVLEVRKFVVDLILSMHPLDCMTCTKAGGCNLQQYAYDFEIKESSFTRKKFGFAVDEANPFIKRDPDYCVLCGRCVRVCKNQGTNVLEFMGRGVGSKVTTANDKPLQESGCTFCGSCVDVCPVNALLEADRWRKGREWEYDKTKSVCLLCGNGCDITVSSKDGIVRKVNAGAMDGSPEKYLCAYGRFGFDCIESDTRVTAPMKRVDGELKETSWEDALAVVAAEMKETGENAGIIASAGMLNEDALTLKNFVADAVKTKNVDTTASLYGSAETLLSGSADPDAADLFVLVDLNPSQQTRALPALDALIRRKVNGGAKLITVNAAEPAIASIAAVKLAGDEAESLKALVKALADKGLVTEKSLADAASGAAVTEDVEQAASLFAAAHHPVVISSSALYTAAANLGLVKGSAIAMPLESNAKGVLLMGLAPAGKSYKEMAQGGTGLLYAIGEVPLSERPKVDFLIVQNSHLTPLARQADVVLPAAAFMEAEGTIVDYAGRVKYVAGVVAPAGEARTHRDIFAALAAAMGAKTAAATEADARNLAQPKAKGTVGAFSRTNGFEVTAEEMMESVNASVINGSRLLWLKEAKIQTASTSQAA